MYEHKYKITKGFTSKYNINRLVWVEEFGDVEDVIAREKQLKNWHKKWKINLIRKNNLFMKDLTDGLL